MLIFNNKIKYLVASSCVLMLGGCANLTHYNNASTSKIGKNNKQQLLSIDAKQRVVATTVNSNQIRTCAEPSPDALSAIAASQGFSLNDGSLEAALKNSVNEGAASIGLRTQSIQLMRDAMYRLCEGYMSGSLDNLTFETLHRRFQTTMVAILAIEQLTGTVKAPAVSIGGDASAGNAELVAKYTELTESRKALLDSATSARDTYKTGDYEKAKTALETKKTTVSSEDGDSTNALTDAEKAKFKSEQDAYDAAEAKSKSNDETVANNKAAYESANAARLAALSGSSSTTRTVKIINSDFERLNAVNTAAVATAVEGIVTSTLQLGFAREFCATILVNNVKTNGAGLSDSTKNIHDGCVDYMNTNTEIRSAEADLILRKGQIVDKVLASDASTDELIALLNTLNGHIITTELDSADAPAPQTRSDVTVPSPWPNPQNTSGYPGYSSNPAKKVNSSYRSISRASANNTERVVPAVTKMETRRVVKTPAATIERQIPAITRQITRRVVRESGDESLETCSYDSNGMLLYCVPKKDK